MMQPDDWTSLPSSPGDKTPDGFGEQRPPGEGRSNRWSYLRWGIWILLLAGAVGLLSLSYFQPGFSDSLALWIAQLQQPSLSQSQRDAELAAAEALRAAGVLVIEEGPQQGVTSVHFTNPKTLSEDSLAQLALLVRLNSLNLTGTPITDAQLAYVAKARTLASLVLNETSIADGGLAHLAPLKQLEVLHLRKTAVTDAGLAQLAALPNLKVLDLSETQVTDQGLAELAKLHQLRWLLLDGTGVTDAGLRHLEHLPRLGQVNLRQTRVTQAGVDRLKKALPGLHVDHQ